METNPIWKLVCVAHVGAAEKGEAFMVGYLILGWVIDMGKDGSTKRKTLMEPLKLNIAFAIMMKLHFSLDENHQEQWILFVTWIYDIINDWNGQ